jgi:hypothetical protein
MVFFLYFDPGLGAMLVQVIVGFIAGIIIFSKNIIFKFKSFFGFSVNNSEGLFESKNNRKEK